MRASRSVSRVAATAVRALHRWRVDRRIVIARSPCDGPAIGIAMLCACAFRRALRRSPCPVPSSPPSTSARCATTSPVRARPRADGSCGRWSRRTRTATVSRARCAPSRKRTDSRCSTWTRPGARARRGGASRSCCSKACFETADLAACSDHDLTTVVHCGEQTRDARAPSSGAPAVGPPEAQHRHEPPRLPAADARSRPTSGCAGFPSVRELTLMTHFANADRPHGATGPVARRGAARRVRGRHGRVAGAAQPRQLGRARSCCPEVARRLGAPRHLLYGGATDEHHPAASLGLRAAMTLTSRIIGVQTLEAGDRGRLRRALRRAATRRGSASWRAATPTAIRATRRTARR